MTNSKYKKWLMDVHQSVKMGDVVLGISYLRISASKWKKTLEHIEKLEQENARLRKALEFHCGTYALTELEKRHDNND